MSQLTPYLLHLVVVAAGWLLLGRAARGREPAAPPTGLALLVAVVAGWVTWRFTSPWPLGDFRQAYLPAGAAVMHGPAALAQMLAKGTAGFVNLPIVAWVFTPFALLSPGIAGLCFTALGTASVVGALPLLVQAATIPAGRRGLLLLIVAAFGPLWYSIVFGNTSHLLLLPLAAGLLSWRAGRELRAGILFGLCAIIKPPLLLLGVYFALRARWRVVAGGLLTVGGISALSIVLLGWEIHVRWFQLCIAPYLGRPVPAYNVQTPAAFFARWEYGPPALRFWFPVDVSRRYRLLAMGATLAILAGSLVAGLRPARARSGGRSIPPQPVLELEFMMTLVVAIIASTLSWSHYYAWLVLPCAWLLGQAETHRQDRITVAMTAGAFVLLMPPVFPVFLPAGPLREVFARAGASYLLAGGVLLWATLVRVRCFVVPEAGAVRG